jgi:hypothetical protein
LDQNQEADFHLGLVQSEVELRDQDDREIGVESKLVASELVVAAAAVA